MEKGREAMTNISKQNKAEMAAFLAGTSCTAYEFFGSHSAKRGRGTGVVFRVWAPMAREISVVGDFNGWDDTKNPMTKIRPVQIQYPRCRRLPRAQERPLCLPHGDQALQRLPLRGNWRL